VRLNSEKLDVLEDLFLENQRAPTLVWYQFKEQLTALQTRFPRCETIVNESTIDRWNAGHIEMLAVHPQSAGHGLNLQGQSKMVWLTLPWSLELYEQAVGRLHRSGQRSDVWNYVLMTEKTVDEQIWKALKDKRSVSDIALEALK
jgi:SNF2 family DNA or RNA helicase